MPLLRRRIISALAYFALFVLFSGFPFLSLCRIIGVDWCGLGLLIEFSRFSISTFSFAIIAN